MKNLQWNAEFIHMSRFVSADLGSDSEGRRLKTNKTVRFLLGPMRNIVLVLRPCENENLLTAAGSFCLGKELSALGVSLGIRTATDPHFVEYKRPGLYLS